MRPSGLDDGEEDLTGAAAGVAGTVRTTAAIRDTCRRSTRVVQAGLMAAAITSDTERI
jgi:hypothetical protein